MWVQVTERVGERNGTKGGGKEEIGAAEGVKGGVEERKTPLCRSS